MSLSRRKFLKRTGQTAIAAMFAGMPSGFFGGAYASDDGSVVRPGDGWVDRTHALGDGAFARELAEDGKREVGVAEHGGGEAIEADDNDVTVLRGERVSKEHEN